jgi:hypothetical protein
MKKPGYLVQAFLSLPSSLVCRFVASLSATACHRSNPTPADLRDCDDLALHRRFDLSWSRRVSLRCLMRSRVVIIVQVIPQGSAQVIFTYDDQMIETLSANRADDAFGVWILERRSRAVITYSICIPFTRNRNSAL